MRGAAPVLVFLALVTGFTRAEAATFTVQGRFLYEDRMWDKNGYTGAVQNLPIRYADVQIVRMPGTTVVANGATDANGNFSIQVTGQTGTINVYARCRTSTDNTADYHIKVVNITGTCAFGSTLFSVTTGTVAHDTNTTPLLLGDWLIQDTTGSGVAQAFNIMDNGVDAFDYLNTAQAIGRYPTAGEFVTYGWNGTAGCNGSFYTGHFIALTSISTDTDGWSDKVILHETGHWASDMFGNDHNVGGGHFIGDNFQDPRLSYGEGYATFFAAQVREFRAPRLNLIGQPVDNHVSIYADLGIPPALPGVGGLEFAYDFENGLFNTGVPIGQIGSANETNITSAMWDLVDGTGTPDESPGSDDDPGDETGVSTWNTIQNHLTSFVPPNWITVEDFYTGWFAANGAGFMLAAMESSYAGLGKMPFRVDAYEPDNTIAQATPVVPATYSVGAGGKVVINEVDLGPIDRFELQNTKNVAVDLTGWTAQIYWNNAPAQFTYTFPSFVLPAGGSVVIQEGGSPANNTPYTLYTGVAISWANGIQGALTLQNTVPAAVDFLRWGGSTVAVPAGTGFTGSLGSAPGGKSLGRDANGADTDAASDFSFLDFSFGTPNLPSIPEHTIYPALDTEMISLSLTGGDVIVLRGESPHSAGEPVVELLNAGGSPLAENRSFDGLTRQAQLQFLVPSTGTYYGRASHGGDLTEFAPLRFFAFKRPVAAMLAPPIALVADPANASDVADAIDLTWLNGAAYDSVRVYRDQVRVASLIGSATSYGDAANRGSHRYDVRGVIGGQESPPATALAFAGILDCTFSDGLEAGTASFDLDSPWGRSSVIAQAGTWSLHDSPAGNYTDNLDISAEILVPTELTAWPTLEFDHICITEATYDFGIVEVSDDFGTTWTELARYDLDDHPGWSDQVANPGDWVHETLDLNPWGGKKVRIRFRLTTDGGVTNDGWYVDNVTISNPSCRSVTAAPDEPVPPAALLSLAGPNPFRGTLSLVLASRAGDRARIQVFDAAGRLVRTLFEGLAPADRIAVDWDGRDSGGRGTSAGLYFLRGESGTDRAVRRVVKLP